MAALSNLEREMALREEAQAALAQSQRLEAVGQLAGGIAHDFNNVLAAISSYLDAVTLRGTDEKIGKVIQNVMDVIQMGASLTRRLLILSHRQGVGLERLDLNDRVTGAIELLRRTLGEQVTVSLRLSPGPCLTSANPGDVDNAILNLAINARDAMFNGGTLTIETRLVTLDADVARPHRECPVRRVRDAHRHRHGTWHEPGGPQACDGATIHDQGAREGHGARPCDGP